MTSDVTVLFRVDRLFRLLTRFEFATEKEEELIESIDLTIEDKAKNTLQSVPPEERCETSQAIGRS